MKLHWLLLVAITALPACSTQPPATSTLGEEEHWIVQVCLPDGVGGAEDLVLDFVGQSSIRSGHGTPVPATYQEHSVVMDYGNEVGDGRALVVNQAGTLYVFPVQRSNTSLMTWSAWQPAAFKTDDYAVTRKMLRGVQADSTATPGEDAPLARFRKMRFVEYLETVRTIRDQKLQDPIPACERT